MPDFQEHLADQAERKIYTEIAKEIQSASSMSIGVPVSPTTSDEPGIEVASPSDPAIDHVLPEADPAEQPVLTAPQVGSSHETEREAERVDWRLSRLNEFIEPSRDWTWSEEEGDQAFQRGCEEWRRRSLAALEGRGIHDRWDALSSSLKAADLCSKNEQLMLQEEPKIDQHDRFGPETHSEHPSDGHQQGRLDENHEMAIVSSCVFVPEPAWVQDYNERRPTTPKTPQQSSLDDDVQVYEPYSPEKLKLPAKMRFAHERDLLDMPDLDHAQVKEADGPTESTNKSTIDRALRSPERLLFLPGDENVGLEQLHRSENSFTSASGTSLMADATPADRTDENDHEHASSDDDDDGLVSHFGTFENMLFVSILRAIVAAEGGLAALSDVLIFEEEEDDDDDDEDEISELELDSED